MTHEEIEAEIELACGVHRSDPRAAREMLARCGRAAKAIGANDLERLAATCSYHLSAGDPRSDAAVVFDLCIVMAESDPTPANLLLLADMARRLRKSEVAVASYRRVIEVAGDNPSYVIERRAAERFLAAHDSLE